MTFVVGDPGHVAEHNNIAAQALTNSAQFSSLNTSVMQRVAKGDLFVSVDEQSGATDDDKLESAFTAAAASTTTKSIWFSPRAYVFNNPHTISGSTGLQLIFAPGSTVQIGAAPTGSMADRARILYVYQSTNVVISGIHVIAPATPLVATPSYERSVIQFEQSSFCRVERGTFDLTNTWAPGNTFVDGANTFQYGAEAVWVKGPSCSDNVIQDCVVTGGRGVMYAYNGGVVRTTVNNVTVIAATENGFSGIGNGAAWSEDCVLDNCSAVGVARIGVEDWVKIRRTVIRDFTITSPGLMGISCVGVGASITNPSISGAPTYAGIELSSSGVSVRGGTVTVGSASPSGIIIDGNVSPGLSVTGTGTTISGTEIRSGKTSVNQSSAINSGQVLLQSCRIYDWVEAAVSLSDPASGGLPCHLTDLYLQNSVPSTSVPSGVRVGLRMNTGGRARGCEVRYVAAANGGTTADIPLYLHENDQTWTNTRLDSTGLTSPAVATASSNGAATTGLSINGLLLTGGAALNLTSIVSPVVKDVTGTTTLTTPMKLLTGAGVEMWAGTGTPEGVVTAPVGSMFRRRDGATGTTLYTKESGAGNTGWVAPVSAAGGTMTGTLTGTKVALTTTTDTNSITASNTNAGGNSNVGINFLAANAASSAFGSSVTGDASTRFLTTADGKINWGDGTAARDTNLYRSGAGALQTDTTLQALRAGFGIAPHATAPLNAARATAGLNCILASVTGEAQPRIALKTDASVQFSDGTLAADTNIYRSAADMLSTDDDLRLATVGKGLRLAEGTNAKAGLATLVAGTKVVSTTAVTANSRIHLTTQSLGTVVAPSALCVSARTAGTSFTILASQGTDTSVIYWSIIEPS
jgi:hypothetical protein